MYSVKINTCVLFSCFIADWYYFIRYYLLMELEINPKGWGLNDWLECRPGVYSAALHSHARSSVPVLLGETREWRGSRVEFHFLYLRWVTWAMSLTPWFLPTSNRLISSEFQSRKASDQCGSTQIRLVEYQEVVSLIRVDCRGGEVLFSFEA